MTTKRKWLLSCATAALLAGTGFLSSAAKADPAGLGFVSSPDYPMKTEDKPQPTAPLPGWWSSGYLEGGWRFFGNQVGREDLAKYYEYRTLKPGAFFDGQTSFGTLDGIYRYDIWAENAGYGDQRYLFNFSQAGWQYFTFMWDQTPHLYSTTAKTLFQGVGTNNLTVPPVLLSPNPLNAAAVAGPNSVNFDNAHALGLTTAVNSLLYLTDLGIRRDTAAVEYRFTPSANWDGNVEYSHLSREGTQPQGSVTYQTNTVARGAGTTTRYFVELPKPVKDTTQDAKTSLEYAGDSWWGQKFNVNVVYGASLYRNSYSLYTWQNPWQTGVDKGAFPFHEFMSLPPDNTMQNVGVTTGIDLPLRSRYMGTVNYAFYRQNDQFGPYTVNPLALAISTPNPGAVVGTTPLPVLPGQSLDARINTLLSNNVLYTQITNDLKSTLKYRYYDVDNQTPEMIWNNWIVGDTANGQPGNFGGTNPNLSIALGGPRRNLSQAYTKQNANADLNWRPTRDLNLGVGYEFERYDRDRREVNVTSENGVKAYLDYRAADWARLRTSYEYLSRHYDTYDYANFVLWQMSSSATNQNSWFMRRYDMANRNRDKANLWIDFYPAEGWTITPQGGLRFDHYGTDPYSFDTRQLGLLRDNTWNAGVEVAYSPTRRISLMASYTYEKADMRGVTGSFNTCNSTTCLGGNFLIPGTTTTPGLDESMRDTVQTFLAGANIEVIPAVFDLKLTFSRSVGYEDWDTSLFLWPASVPSSTSYNLSGTFPRNYSKTNRFDAQGKYKLDPYWVRSMGWNGDVYAKVRYMWEKVDISNWQNDIVTPYMQLLNSANKGYILMDWFNPNYNVQMIGVALAATW
jgi:MtrB/PioB family decaheme-associated outer membrane protein